MQQLTLTESEANIWSEFYGREVELVRLSMGTANNAAWAACLDAMDHIRQHPRYRQQIKGGSTPQKGFKRCFDMLKEYQRKLIYCDTYNCFHVDQLKPEYRRCFPDNFTDADYYDFWSAFGFKAYQDTKPFFTSLVNKVRIAYVNHNIPNSEIMAWAAAAQLVLYLSTDIWDATMLVCLSIEQEFTHHIPMENKWKTVFANFNLKKISDFWKSCTLDLEPKINLELTETESLNISDGYYQLKNKWTSIKVMFESRMKSAEDYSDIFRTKGEMKKLIREYADRKAECENQKA